MDKTTSMKKRENYIKFEEGDSKELCVKIELSADHILDPVIIHSIEEQIFNIKLIINSYELQPSAQEIKAECKKKKDAEKVASDVAKNEAKKEAEQLKLRANYAKKKVVKKNSNIF